ncbi:LysR family transcriptional regulator [Burkholderia sp. L27(2015)]|uniref:LysR family transcriptional regulator n=1 Tax=Burkholderia sp. L27(2015) TaxID=1641858 RepID=UPI0020B1551D|nr:LysR family transcriptional regulator [Burkholderia sp. L27(2015)]
MKFDIESLRIFVAVVEEGSIAAVASRTHLIASAVSKRVSDLEDGIGTLLLYRHSRGIEPTAAGEALYHHAKRLSEYLQQISDEMSEYSAGLIGHARVYVNFTAMVQYLPNVLRSFLSENPKVHIELFEKSSDDVVTMPYGSSISKLCRAAAERAGKRLRIRIEVTSFEGVRNMVSAGLGIGVLPRESVKPYIQSELFRTIAK